MFKTGKLARLVIPVVAAAAFQTLVAGTSAVAPVTSKPTQALSASATTPSTKKPAAKAAVRSSAGRSPITIGLTSGIRHGNLVVMLDGVPVFNEAFKKPALLISQTTIWDPIQVPAGDHKLTAKLFGEKKILISATYDLIVSRTGGIELRFRTKGDKLTVGPAS